MTLTLDKSIWSYLHTLFFHTIEEVLIQLEQQPGWEKYREYRQLLECWQQTVSLNIAKNTRPLYISRQVVWVATSSAARAQELSFQRHNLLKKLNNQLPYTLKDIRFSSSQWHQITKQKQPDTILFEISNKQKSKISSTDDSSSFNKPVQDNCHNSHQTSSSGQTARAAAESWLRTIKKNSSSFLSCPNCDSPTPIKEIERWNLCYLCVAQKWSREYHPTTFPERI